MDTNEERKLLCRDEVYAIVGAAIEVLNGLGHGLHEKPYENALIVELRSRQIPYKQQPGFDMLYKGERVGLLSQISSFSNKWLWIRRSSIRSPILSEGRC